MSTLDDSLKLLADAQRRELVRSLIDAGDDPVSVEVDDPATRTRLYHVHLAKLVDAGVIDWDPRDDLIARGPAFDEVATLLEAIDAAVEEGKS